MLYLMQYLCSIYMVFIWLTCLFRVDRGCEPQLGQTKIYEIDICCLFIIVEQELLTLLEYLSSIMVFSEVCVAQSLVLCVVFCQLLFVFFPLAIVLSVLPFMASDYPFGIFKLFLQNQIVMI
jgi:hypothetical protein